jgi:hypothetical protein
MLKQALGTAVAAVFATALASAQTPAPGQHHEQHQRAGQQMVTVEGCLQADGVAGAQVADATRDEDRTFMLVNAEIKDGAMAADRPGERATGQEIGTTGQAGVQTESPVGTTGAAADTGTKFKVTGLDEERLQQYAGQRVRIEGHIEGAEQQYGVTGAERRDDQRTDADRPTADPAAPGTPGAAGTTGTPETPATGAGAYDRDRAADDREGKDAKKLHAVSIQPVAGTCPDAPASR